MLFAIRHYIFIMLLCGLMFANCFFQLGKNQIAFDRIETQDQSSVNYASTLKSYWYIYYMLIAEPDYTMFTLGDGSFAWPLYVLFAVTTFTM